MSTTEPQTFRKTATVEAMQVHPDSARNENLVSPNSISVAAIQGWMRSGGFRDFEVFEVDTESGLVYGIRVKSLEGWVEAYPGDWICKGVEGEFWRVKQEIFAKTYAKAEDEVTGSTSDGFHTFDELYEFRMLYHAAFVNTLEASRTIGVGGGATVKSLKHSDGEFCFGGGWFIVVTELPHGQISNHYESKHWDLFRVPAVDIPPAFDDHTSEDVIERLRMFAEFWKAYR